MLLSSLSSFSPKGFNRALFKTGTYLKGKDSHSEYSISFNKLITLPVKAAPLSGQALYFNICGHRDDMFDLGVSHVISFGSLTSPLYL